MIDISLKPAASEDCGKIAEIDKICFTDPWSETAVRKLYDSGTRFNVAILDGKAVGFCAYDASAGLFCELYRIAVLPEFRRNGAGGLMLKNLISYSAASGCDKILLEVRESGLPAIALYRKYGFVSDGIRKNYYSSPTENAVLMSLDLHRNAFKNESPVKKV